jgi:hypothetical protein
LFDGAGSDPARAFAGRLDTGPATAALSRTL